jgi:UDP-N-acetylglucosamine 2-epimerase (non-hydrolysing)
MKNICIIIGTRPNFIKAFPVYKALNKYFNLKIIHTGQHFDEHMSNIFFQQLNFSKPDIHLNLVSKTRAGSIDDKLYFNNQEYLTDLDNVINDLTNKNDIGQISEIRDKLINEFTKFKFNLIIVFGDVTSTLGAALAAHKLNIPLAHVESGLRSKDISMPEEVNRIIVDKITDLYFVTEESGIKNLKYEGVTDNVFYVGNTMIDTQKEYLNKCILSNILNKLGLETKNYVLLTLHRPSNVDDIDKLKDIIDQLNKLDYKIVYPVHPRTKKNLDRLETTNIHTVEPLGYIDFTCLIYNSKYVITDSGGIQEETTALNIPCFTLRPNTERPSTLIENHGTNQLINNISDINFVECKNSVDLWDGKASIRICDVIKNILYPKD